VWWQRLLRLDKAEAEKCYYPAFMSADTVNLSTLIVLSTHLFESEAKFYDLIFTLEDGRPRLTDRLCDDHRRADGSTSAILQSCESKPITD